MASSVEIIKIVIDKFNAKAKVMICKSIQITVYGYSAHGFSYSIAALLVLTLRITAIVPKAAAAVAEITIDIKT